MSRFKNIESEKRWREATFTIERAKKISDTLKRIGHTIPKWHKIWNKGLKGIHLSLNTEFKKGKKGYWLDKKRPDMTGEKHPLWVGGISSENQKARTNFRLDFWRESVFKRDNWTCLWCGQTGGELNADHIKMFAFYPKLRFEINNGQTLCKSCHKWKTKWDVKIFMGKVPELNIYYGSRD